MARVSHLGTTSEDFPVTNGTKQGCLMAPLLFCIVFSAMLQDAFRNCSSGVLIRFRSDSGIFNLQRLTARTKVSLLLLWELLFADDCALTADTEDCALIAHTEDCALTAHTEDELQSILNDFPRAASRYGLTISITKTEVMLQPKPGSSSHDPVIKISDKQLKAVQKFYYLGGFLSQNACIDDEITS